MTVVALGGSGLTLTQTDSYVVGSESYRTDIVISNSTPDPHEVVVSLRAPRTRSTRSTA